ncbi:MAG: nucleoside hydrolase, partial [Actinomycetota bacterium]
MTDRIPVLFDTDIGSDIDDAVALAYLLRQPRCELVGVTTVSGGP